MRMKKAILQERPVKGDAWTFCAAFLPRSIRLTPCRLLPDQKPAHLDSPFYSIVQYKSIAGCAAIRGAAVFGGLRMQQTFEHLLGLPAESALAILRASGITGVQVKATAAPPRRASSPADALRTPEGEAQGYASTRVVAVEDDGRTLIVSRFLTGMPRERSQS